MDASYLHLLVNHVPIILFAFGAAAALLALLVRKRGVWLYAVASITIAGASAYPVMLTGHAAEDVMRKAWYVDKDAIATHEDSADVATWTMIAAGVICAVVWWRLARAPLESTLVLSRFSQALVLLAALAGLSTVSYAAWQGGKIVHGAERLATPPPGFVPPPAESSAHHM
jgi:hypothetical protein